jgi:phage replication-related protein YjqB (UPF0714/DUF867 family)
MRFAELLATPGVHEESVLRSTFGFMAFHGGNLERVTDDIARTAARRSGSSYYGVIQDYPLREHLPSIEVNPRSSPVLAAFLNHVEVVIAIHGYGRDGLWTSVLLGGTNRNLAGVVAQVLTPMLPRYTILDDLEAIPKELRGLHSQNPVNLPRLGGVQIELPPRIRGLTPQAATMERTDGRIAPTNDLIDGLVETVALWNATPAYVRSTETQPSPST